MKMIPSQEEGYHVLPMEHPLQQPHKYQNRLQSWHKPSQYTENPFQHQNQLHRLHGDGQQASIMRNFPNIDIKSEENFSKQSGVSRSSHWTIDDVYGFAPVAGFETNHDTSRRTYQRYFDPRISTQPTIPLSPFYANYYSLDGEQPHCHQRQTPHEEGTGTTLLPLTTTYDQFQMEMVHWNSSTQQRSLGTVLEPGLNHPEDTDNDGGSGITTSNGIYRQNLAPSLSYDDYSNIVVVKAPSSSSSLLLTAANVKERIEATSSVTPSVTSSVTSSSRCLRTDVANTEARKIRLASSTSRGKTRTREKYRSVYTDQQRLGLETAFDRGAFIDARRKADIAETVGLSERQVKIWFQNRRAKDRRTRRKATSATQGSDGRNACVSTTLGFPRQRLNVDGE